MTPPRSPARRRWPLLAALALALAAAAPTGRPPAAVQQSQRLLGAPDPELGGATWHPHPRPLAALLLVADGRSDPRLVGELLALLQSLRFDVLLFDGTPTQAPHTLRDAWRRLRQRLPGRPLALAGHGFGATLATVMADGLEADERPQLLWLLAPGREGDGTAAPAHDLRRPEAALARVDALCVGTRQRATQVLLLQGTDDTLVAAERARAIADAAPAATLYRATAAGHHDLLARTEVRERLGHLLLGWAVQARRAGQRRDG